MLLVVDVGNTNITCGIYDGEEMTGRFRITTKIPRTSDEFGMMICNLIEQRGLKITDVT
ncbi:MAG: type III pantothenate kinase, partial [Lachnospiraceae bacterium]|nr:type III pantothenate kinase [Lachnospiraceae bacterium]